MKTLEEWAQFEWENPLMTTGDFIAEIQKDACNQGIQDSLNIAITSKRIHDAELDDDEWDDDSLWCNKYEILKLKIK